MQQLIPLKRLTLYGIGKNSVWKTDDQMLMQRRLNCYLYWKGVLFWTSMQRGDIVCIWYVQSEIHSKVSILMCSFLHRSSGMHHGMARSGKHIGLLRSQWKHHSFPGWLCISHGTRKEADWRYCLSAWLYWHFLLWFTMEEWKENCELNAAFIKTIKLLFKIFKENTFTNNSLSLKKVKSDINQAIICTHPMPFLSFIGENANKLWETWSLRSLFRRVVYCIFLPLRFSKMMQCLHCLLFL